MQIHVISMNTKRQKSSSLRAQIHFYHVRMHYAWDSSHHWSGFSAFTSLV